MKPQQHAAAFLYVDRDLKQEENKMILLLKQHTDQQQIDNLVQWLKSQGLETHLSEGQFQTILGLIGDTTSLDTDLLTGLDIVEDVKRIQEPYKNANRKFHPKDTVVEVGGNKIGHNNFQIIAGPCSVESLSLIHI